MIAVCTPICALLRCANYHAMPRVYDCGINSPKSNIRLVHSLKGFKNKNWPIRFSFYCGSGYNSFILNKSSASNDVYGDSDLAPHPGNYLFDLQEPKEEKKSVILATGGVYPYSFGKDSAMS